MTLLAFLLQGGTLTALDENHGRTGILHGALLFGSVGYGELEQEFWLSGKSMAELDRFLSDVCNARTETENLRAFVRNSTQVLPSRIVSILSGYERLGSRVKVREVMKNISCVLPSTVHSATTFFQLRVPLAADNDANERMVESDLSVLSRDLEHDILDIIRVLDRARRV
jgi:hypothetical protein